MKKNRFLESERHFRDDVNLREALSRRCSDEPQLPSDFARQLHERIRAEHERKQVHHFPLRRGWHVAAVLSGVMLLSGVVFAVVRCVMPSDPEPSVPSLCDSIAPLEPVRPQGTVMFDNVRLDSILGMMARHYGRSVCFRHEGIRRLRLSTGWRKTEPLGRFIRTLNEFDGLRLTDVRDTVFVEQVTEEAGK